MKPAITEEVVARTRALLRRNASQPIRVGRKLFIDEHFVIDVARREVRLDNQSVHLTPTEFRIVYCLAKHAGEVVSPERLVMQVWGSPRKSSPETVKVYVHRLRRKLETDPLHPQRIVTRRGMGYMFRELTQSAESVNKLDEGGIEEEHARLG